jgi:hypothetical protein
LKERVGEDDEAANWMGWMAPDGINVPRWWSSKITSNGSHPSECKKEAGAELVLISVGHSRLKA